jgi:hypothetical protein
MRTRCDRKTVTPGHFAFDTAAHCGGPASGQYCKTLTGTDVSSGWVEERPLLNTANRWVQEAFADIGAGLPFPLKGARDSPNWRDRAKTPSQTLSGTFQPVYEASRLLAKTYTYIYKTYTYKHMIYLYVYGACLYVYETYLYKHMTYLYVYEAHAWKFKTAKTSCRPYINVSRWRLADNPVKMTVFGLLLRFTVACARCTTTGTGLPPR